MKFDLNLIKQKILHNKSFSASTFMNFEMKYPATYFNKPPRKRKNGTQQPIVPPPKKVCPKHKC